MTKQQFRSLRDGDAVDLPGGVDRVAHVEFDFDYSTKPPKRFAYKVYMDSGYTIMETDKYLPFMYLI